MTEKKQFTEEPVCTPEDRQKYMLYVGKDNCVWGSTYAKNELTEEEKQARAEAKVRARAAAKVEREAATAKRRAQAVVAKAAVKAEKASLRAQLVVAKATARKNVGDVELAQRVADLQSEYETLMGKA